VAKKVKKTVKAPKKRTRREYSKTDLKELRAHSKAKTPVRKIAKLTKREAALRMKARTLGIPLGVCTENLNPTIVVMKSV
jgi:hypothetical protein